MSALNIAICYDIMELIGEEVEQRRAMEVVEAKARVDFGEVMGVLNRVGCESWWDADLNGMDFPVCGMAGNVFDQLTYWTDAEPDTPTTVPAFKLGSWWDASED
jgi:hypothetical protein